jgi:heptosyltransferase II
MQLEENRIERILVRAPNWIGDAVMSAPALAALRDCFPAARITLLASPRTAELFEGAGLDEIIPYRRQEEGVKAFFRAVRAIRAGRFDLALLFQNAFEAALLAVLGGARMRVGFNEQGRGPLLTTDLHHGPPHRNRHQVYDYLDIVWVAERAYWLPLLKSEMKGLRTRTRRVERRITGRNPDEDAILAEMDSIRIRMAQIEAVTDRLQHPSTQTKFLTPENYPRLTVSPRQRAAARARLAQAGVPPEQAPGHPPLIAFNAGATNSRAKCWPPDRFAALADLLLESTGGRIVMLGAASERANAEAVLARMRGNQERVLNLAGDTTMSELIGLLDCCDLLVSNDTGPAHIAAALGRPTLTIFGPTNEFETAPVGAHSELIRAGGVECARCMHRDCPIDHRCMTRISAEDVFEKARAMIGSRARAGERPAAARHRPELNAAPIRPGFLTCGVSWE